MPLKMQYHLKCNVTQNGMLLKWNFTQNEVSIKMECYSKWNVTQNWCHLKWDVTQNEI